MLPAHTSSFLAQSPPFPTHLPLPRWAMSCLVVVRSQHRTHQALRTHGGVKKMQLWPAQRSNGGVRWFQCDKDAKSCPTNKMEIASAFCQSTIHLRVPRWPLCLYLTTELPTSINVRKENGETTCLPQPTSQLSQTLLLRLGGGEEKFWRPLATLAPSNATPLLVQRIHLPTNTSKLLLPTASERRASEFGTHSLALSGQQLLLPASVLHL